MKINPKNQTEELNRARLEFLKRNPEELKKLTELFKHDLKQLDELTTRLATVGGEVKPELKQSWNFFFDHAGEPFDADLSEQIQKIEIPKAVNAIWRWIDYCMELERKKLLVPAIPGTQNESSYEVFRSGVFDMYCRDAREIFTLLTNNRPAVHLLMGVDLTRSKGVILAEVEQAVTEYQRKIGIHEAPEKRLKWLPIVDELLAVWDAWAESGQRRCFRQIAKKLNLSESTVKDRWRQAYRLIHGKAYSKEVAAASADELCAKCQDFKKCYREKDGVLDFIPCPAYLKLAGKSYTREKLTENFDALDSTE